MAATGKFKFAILDGDAVLIGNHEAWTHLGGAWKEISYADAFSKAKLIGLSTFRAAFGPIDDTLPATAFELD